MVFRHSKGFKIFPIWKKKSQLGNVDRKSILCYINKIFNTNTFAQNPLGLWITPIWKLFKMLQIEGVYNQRNFIVILDFDFIVFFWYFIVWPKLVVLLHFLKFSDKNFIHCCTFTMFKLLYIFIRSPLCWISNIFKCSPTNYLYPFLEDHYLKFVRIKKVFMQTMFIINSLRPLQGNPPEYQIWPY